MKILFVPVTYNSYDALDNYIASVGKALDAAADPTISVTIHVADNSTVVESGKWKEESGKRKVERDLSAAEYSPSSFHFPLSTNLSLLTTHYPNPGYLPAALKTIYSEDYASYDYIIISNVDVTLDETFFTTLRDLKADADTVWIAPFIWSPSEQRDVNPKIQERYTKKRLRLLRLFFRFPLVWYSYSKTVYRLRKQGTSPAPSEVEITSPDPSEGGECLAGSDPGRPSSPSGRSGGVPIYAGHGSFMIFRPEIFQQEPKLDYPVFLFCEEIYMAEMARRIGKKVAHCPAVKVWDKEHASTGLMGLWRYCKYNHDALSYIIRTFYEQD